MDKISVLGVKFDNVNMDEAIKHCTKGLGIWEFASNDEGHEPDLVMACAGESPTIETLAATKILRENFPKLKISRHEISNVLMHPYKVFSNDVSVPFITIAPLILLLSVK